MSIELAFCSMSSWTVETLERLGVTFEVVADHISGTHSDEVVGSILIGRDGRKNLVA